MKCVKFFSILILWCMRNIGFDILKKIGFCDDDDKVKVYKLDLLL